MNVRHARIIAGAASLLCLRLAGASGVSPYLPLHTSPEMEREIERVLILADKPVLTRPIAAATVLEALPKACEIDEALCRRVRRYLERYTAKVGVSDLSVGAAAASGSDIALPNARGQMSDSAWAVAGRAYWQPNPYVLIAAGGVAHEDEARPSGSVLSVGFQYAQLDIGYREHWLSPFRESAMLISTQAPTMPSATLSNYAPISPLGFRYEVFLAEMDESDRIRFGNRFTSGEPQIAGLHFSIEPTPGWSIGGNRIMQFGGGERGGRTLDDFLNALWDPGGFDASTDTTQEEEFGNQAAAWSSRFIFPGEVPFSAYLQYAGEDRAYEGNYRFGNAALSIGLSWPRLWDNFDLTYEASDWQNNWYTHGIYGDGLTVDRHVIGHWGADARRLGNGVGATAHLLRLGWQPPFGGLFHLRARTVNNSPYTRTRGVRTEYERAFDLALAYSGGVAGFTTGAEITAGKDVFGDSFARIEGFVRLGDEWCCGVSGRWAGLSRPEGAELFVDAGVNSAKVRVIVDEVVPELNLDRESAPHFGIGARRRVSKRGDLGVRAEMDRVNEEWLLGLRAVDYRYRIGNAFALTGFLGAARYDLATPAYGYYGGVGVQWRNIIQGLSLSIDAKYADKVARDKARDADPPIIVRNDIFYDISSVALYLTYAW